MTDTTKCIDVEIHAIVGMGMGMGMERSPAQLPLKRNRKWGGLVALEDNNGDSMALSLTYCIAM